MVDIGHGLIAHPIHPAGVASVQRRNQLFDPVLYVTFQLQSAGEFVSGVSRAPSLFGGHGSSAVPDLHREAISDARRLDDRPSRLIGEQGLQDIGVEAMATANRTERAQ